jgi:hypothetical protein
MASSLSNLPDDLVIAIATELKRVGGSTSDLLSLTLASKRWHRLGLPIFYANLTLTNATLVRFVNSFNADAHGKHVRSLTARFEADAGVHPTTLAMFTGPAGPPVMSSEFSGFGFSTGSRLRASTPAKVYELLEQLVPTLPSFVNLRSFSLYVAQSPYRSIPRATIIALLEALPSSCTNLELDTRGQDHREEDEQAHVCDVIRGLLPPMHPPCAHPDWRHVWRDVQQRRQHSPYTASQISGGQLRHCWWVADATLRPRRLHEPREVPSRA